MALQFPSFEVALDVLLIDLIDGQLAEEGLRLVECLNTVGLMDLPKAVGAKLHVVDGMLVIFIENVVQDALSFDVLLQVLAPDLPGSFLVLFAAGVELWHDDEFLEGVVQMFLVVMEGGVCRLLYFLFLLHFTGVLFISHLRFNGNSLYFLDHHLQGPLGDFRKFLFKI
jgi:hypothetical protein